MGKSRPTSKSTALKRQRAFFDKDRSRLERNELKYSILEDFVEHEEQKTSSSASSDRAPSISFLQYQNYLEDVCHKRKSTREKALQKLVMAFESHVLNDFVKSTYITLLYRCLSSIKKGTKTEAHLACHLIGLLAVTIDSEDASHELMKDSVSQLCEAFQFGSDTLKLPVLQCLAMITFFGASSSDEVQNSMKFIWTVCTSETNSTPTIVAAALSAWSFLLSTIDGWRIHSENWKGSISFLSTLVDKDQYSVVVALAMALIFEIDGIYKFSEEASAASVESLKCKLYEKVKKLYKECGDRSSIGTYFNNQKVFFQSILQYFETNIFHEVLVNIGNEYEILRVSKWNKFIQLRYMQYCLQDGFWSHMHENERLQDTFMLTKINKENPRLEEIFRKLTTADPKERTQLRNKQRKLAQEKHSLFLCS